MVSLPYTCQQDDICLFTPCTESCYCYTYVIVILPRSNLVIIFYTVKYFKYYRSSEPYSEKSERNSLVRLMRHSRITLYYSNENYIHRILKINGFPLLFPPSICILHYFTFFCVQQQDFDVVVGHTEIYYLRRGCKARKNSYFARDHPFVQRVLPYLSPVDANLLQYNNTLMSFQCLL